MGSGQKVVYFN